jgi:hypothetical protein
MTSSNKGLKLYLHPKMEDETFLPINNCENGGINFNNMIPVNDKIFHKADLILRQGDPKWGYEKKLNLINAQRFIRRNIEKIVSKAMSLYDMKMTGRLNYGKNKITCNFKRLEIALGYYGAFISGEFSAVEIADRVKNMIIYEKKA